MKTTGLTKKRSRLIALGLAASLFLAAANFGLAQSAQIGARPLTPQEIHDLELTGVYASGGLMTVGVGESVYLEAKVESGTVVNGVTWSIESRPLAVPPSSAVLQDSPLPADLPIYSPGDRYVLELAGRKLFVPDVPGQFLIQAVVATNSGSLVLQSKVTSGMYTGAGNIANANPVYPQCALCHAENAIGWLDTGHASFFEEAVDGIKSSHYGENCLDCHVLGGHNPEAQNNNFFNVAEKEGWTFPTVLEPGNWDAMPAALQAKANIQCEHCHGAGSEHHGDKTAIAVSFNAGDCGQCHDEAPYHNKNKEWLNSTHARVTDSPTGEGRGSCIKCHTAMGFVGTLDGKSDITTDYEAISCAACHDPHDAANHGQLRTVAAVTFENGVVAADGGAGNLCLNCHKARRNAESYVNGSVSSHFGPHYGVQGDMFNGTNAIDYGKVKGRPSAHAYAVENSCVGCHMQAIPNGDPARFLAGGHTFKPVWDNGTPEDHGDDVDMVGACVDCHGEVEDFNFELADYNLDGKVEGVQTEVHHLLEALAMHLPPKGEPIYTFPGSSYQWTASEKKALYNYLCVEEDGSHGIHNPRYMTQILKASIDDLADPFNGMFQGMNVPYGGEWFYSPWFEFYAPQTNPGWIYHFEHGHLYVTGDANVIYLYDNRAAQWRYTTPEVYPYMYEIGTGTWMYYGGRYEGLRYFYNYTSGQWGTIN